MNYGTAPAELRKLLYNPGFYSYNGEVSNCQDEARQRLLEVSQVLQRCHPQRCFELGPHRYYGYLASYTTFCRMLEYGNYCAAYNELGSILHHYPILQPRIYYPLLDVLATI